MKKAIWFTVFFSASWFILFIPLMGVLKNDMLVVVLGVMASALEFMFIFRSNKEDEG